MIDWRIKENIVIISCNVYFTSVQLYAHIYQQFLQLTIGKV